VPEWNLGLGLTVSGRSALRVENYYIAGVLVLVLLVLLRNLIHSPRRARVAGHPRPRDCAGAMASTPPPTIARLRVDALLAAMAGVFFTHYTGGIGPSEASAFKSVRYVALAASGGMASLWGVTGMSTLLNYLSLAACSAVTTTPCSARFSSPSFRSRRKDRSSRSDFGCKHGWKNIWSQTGGSCNGEQMNEHSGMEQHRTLNAEHRTPNIKAVFVWLQFDVQSSMFNVRCYLLKA